MGPFGFGAAGFDEGLLFLLFVVEHGHDERLAEAFWEAQLEDDALLRLLHLAVGGAEEGVVAVAAVGGVGAEMAGAVVVGHHASFLAGAVAVRHEMGILLEGAGVDVDVAVLVEDRLGLDVDVVDEDFLFFTHCF